MTKLPVLYVSCDRAALKASRAQSSIRRLTRDRDVGSVVFITLDAGLAAPKIYHQTGSNSVACQLQSLLSAEGFGPVEVSGDSGDLMAFASTLTSSTSGEVTELRLNLGMTGAYYRGIGRCLEVCRDRGVLIICFDQTDAGEVGNVRSQPHNAYIRNLISQWEDQQRWARAFSKPGAGEEQSSDSGELLSDPTLCILNTAFSLGGMQVPQRVFGSALNEGRQSLAGYGWMQ